MSKLEFNVTIFVIGCIGALAPEILRLYNLRTNPQFEWSWFYLGISVCFALLGGLIAWILPTTTYYGAFYAGVATPVIVSTILRRADLTTVNSEEIRHVIREELQELRDILELIRKARDRGYKEEEIKAAAEEGPDILGISKGDEKTLQGMIEKEAYEIYEKRGGEHGKDLDDWLEAERISHIMKSEKRKVSRLLHDYFQALFTF